MPPWPGKSVPESLAPAQRLSRLSSRSPTMPERGDRDAEPDGVQRRKPRQTELPDQERADDAAGETAQGALDRLARRDAGRQAMPADRVPDEEGERVRDHQDAEQQHDAKAALGDRLEHEERPDRPAEHAQVRGAEEGRGSRADRILVEPALQHRRKQQQHAERAAREGQPGRARPRRGRARRRPERPPAAAVGCRGPRRARRTRGGRSRAQPPGSRARARADRARAPRRRAAAPRAPCRRAARGCGRSPAPPGRAAAADQAGTIPP